MSFLAVGLHLLFAGQIAFAASQTVTAYVYWGDEWKANIGAATYVTPTTASVSSSGSGSSVTFTAKTIEGWKVSNWYTAADGTKLQPTMWPYKKYTEYPGEQTFVWKYNSGLSALGLRFDPIQYTVRFDSNGGSGGMGVQTNVYTNVYQAASCSFTRPGYAFDQWEVSGIGKFNVGDTINTGKALGVTTDGQVVTMKALWKEATVTATLDCHAEGATVSPTSVEVTYLGTYPQLPVPVREGYAFDGWYTETEGGTQIKAGTTCTQASAHVLYAHWLKLWSVTFQDSSLFASAIITNRQVKNGGSVSPPTAPVHVGYTFTGWLGWKDSNFSQIEQDRTYTADYQANSYSVCYHKNDGSGLTNTQSDFKYGESKALATDVFNRLGYTLKGWSESAESKTVKYGDGALVLNLAESGTYHLYAVWEAAVYEVAFNPNGGKGSMSPVEMVYDQAQALPQNTFTWDGVDFLGWQGPDGKHYEDGAVVSNLSTGAAIELKAQWSQYYFVAFDGNGATNVEEYVQRYENSLDIKPLTDNRYERAGYTFTGWATNLSDAAAYVVAYTNAALYSSSVAAPGETNRLYAVWTNNLYRVIFDGNGAEAGSMAPQTFAYDVPQALTANGFERDEALWEFVGWTNRMTGVFYADKEVVSNLTAEADAEVTLHACWKSLLSDLSKAMKCENLNWTSPGRSVIHGVWYPVVTNAAMKGDSCAVMTDGQQLGEMMAQISTNGLLRFYWKASEMSAQMHVEIEGNSIGTNYSATVEQGNWNCVMIDTRDLLPKDKAAQFPLRIYLGKQDAPGEPAIGYVDCVSWIPGGDQPEPGEKDRPVVNDLTIGGDDVSLTVSNVSEFFDYRLNGTNDLTAPMPWPVLKSVPGVAGGTLELSVPKQANEPKMFYTVEVLKKQ